MSLHGDGINDELYFLLWAKDDLNYGPSVNIPDTIIYKFGQPVAWYFTALDGKVRRKNKQNLINVRIEEALTKYMIAGDIVASYISLPTGYDDGAAGGGGGSSSTASSSAAAAADTQTRIEYFDRNALHDFLYNRWKESNGVLQRFIEPKGTHNSMIRAIWSPKVCLMERRANVRQIFDRRFGLYERAVTYEGQEYHSKVHPLRGNILATQIQRVCEEIVEHVAEVTFQKQCIARIVLNFKVDAKDKLYLLWSSSIRLSDGRHFSVSADVAKKVRRNSLNIDAQLKLPMHIRLADRANHSVEQPAPVQYIDCMSCGGKAPVDCFHELPYKTIMGHYENLIWLLTSDPGSAVGGGSTTNKGGVIEWPPDARVVEAAGGVGFGCLGLHHDDMDEQSGGGGGADGHARSSHSSRRKGAGEEEGGHTDDEEEEGGDNQSHEEGADDGSASASRRRRKKGGGGSGGKKRGMGQARKALLTIEDVSIPPIIRHLHPKLKLPAYKRYRKDPLFLYKAVSVCETCYLVYAEFANSSFNTNPMLFMLIANPALSAMFGGRRTTAGGESRASSSTTYRSSRHMCRRPAHEEEEGGLGKHYHQHSRAGRSTADSYRPASIGRPAIHAPSFPQVIHNAQEAGVEYGDVLERIHTAAATTAPPTQQGGGGGGAGGGSVVSSAASGEEVIQSREDAFFRDAYKSRELSKQHPLLHLITTYRKLADVNKIELGDVELGHLSQGPGKACKLGMTFAGYADEMHWKSCNNNKKNKAGSKGRGRGTSASNNAAAAGTYRRASSAVPGSAPSSAPYGTTKGGGGVSSNSSSSSSGEKHKEFLMKTLLEIQQQLSSPGAMTRSILESISDEATTAAASQHKDGGDKSRLVLLPPVQQQAAAPMGSARRATDASSASSVLAASHSSTTSTTASSIKNNRKQQQRPSTSSSSKGAPAGPHSSKGKGGGSGKAPSSSQQQQHQHGGSSGKEHDKAGKEEEEEGDSSLPRVVFQDEVTVPLVVDTNTTTNTTDSSSSGAMKEDGQAAAAVLSVTAYEEEQQQGGGKGGDGDDGEGPSPSTQLLFSCVVSSGVMSHGDVGGRRLLGPSELEPGRWKVVVSERQLGISEGALRGMRARDREDVAKRAAAALRLGGGQQQAGAGARFIFVDQQALLPR